MSGQEQSESAPDAGRIFTERELQDFSKDCMDLALEAIDDGDLERARYWCRREAETKNLTHDMFVDWLAALCSFICDTNGEETVVQVIRELMVAKFSNTESVAERRALIEEKGLRAWVTWCIELARQHHSYPGLTVAEDDEKIIITLNPCGSGGRLINAGLFEGEDGYRKLRKPGPHTWGETDIPVYCVHCPLGQEIIPIEVGGPGAQFWVHASPFPKKPGDPCIHYLYKNPADIPQEYYERLGMNKDGSKAS
ncbi:MAG: hypothetical protein ACOX8Q_09795 [Christensenellales bacterium]|jgi:hypothetical protein